MGAAIYSIARWLPRSFWLFGVIAGVYMAIMIVFSVQRFIAYYKWKSQIKTR